MIVHARYVQWPDCWDRCGKYTLHPCNDAGWVPQVDDENQVIAWLRAETQLRTGGVSELLDDLQDAWFTQGPDDNGHFPAGVEIRTDTQLLRASFAGTVRFNVVGRSTLGLRGEQ